MKNVRYIILYTVCLFAVIPRAWCNDIYGVVTEVAGHAELKKDSTSDLLEFGQDIFIGDTLHLDKAADVTVISYIDCTEWALSGPGEVSFSSDRGPTINGRLLSYKRLLPVCFNPEELEIAGTPKTGGLVLRGAVLKGKDEQNMEALRMEAEAGIASNATLLTLVMYYLIEQNSDKARPYFNQLKGHVGNTPLIRRIEKAFPSP